MFGFKTSIFMIVVLQKIKTLNRNFENESKVMLTLATKSVNQTEQSQNNTKTSDDTNFQSEKCLSEATCNPTSQVSRILQSTTSKTTPKAKGKRRKQKAKEESKG